jgi:hypothetical protein
MLPRSSSFLATVHVKCGHRALRRLRQRDRELRALPRNPGPGDGHENAEPSSYQFLSIDTPGNRNQKGPSVLGRAASDLLMESAAFGGGFRPNEQQPIADCKRRS